MFWVQLIALILVAGFLLGTLYIGVVILAGKVGRRGGR